MTTLIKPSYGSSVALLSTALNSLASDGALISGWSSAVVDNTSNLSISETLSCVFKTGSTPTAGQIYVYLWGILDDTPTYPDAITGSQGAIALASATVRDSGAFKLLPPITTDTTTNRLYYLTENVPKWFGGYMPKKWGTWVVHNTVAALASSGNVISRCDITQLQQV